MTDSLVEYWQRTAENEGIEFPAELSIPMEMPVKGADISLILGNLLRMRQKGAGKARERKCIKLKVKYDKKNLLIVVENSYGGELIKVKRGTADNQKGCSQPWDRFGICS